jgi:hypothetical protein
MPSPAVMTYATLVADIKTYCERPNDAQLAAQIPRLILLAESECASDLKVLGNELVAQSTMTTGDPVIAKPDFWRDTVSLMITVPGVGRRELPKRLYEYLRNFWPDQAAVDVPRFYAEYNSANFLIAPTPAADYAFELIYHARLEPLSDSTQSNWFTGNTPQLLLYSCMYHASLYLKNFGKAAQWRGSYETALAMLTKEDARRTFDRTVAKT